MYQLLIHLSQFVLVRDRWHHFPTHISAMHRAVDRLNVSYGHNSPREDIIQVFRGQEYLSSVLRYGSRVCYIAQKRTSFNYR